MYFPAGGCVCGLASVRGERETGRGREGETYFCMLIFIYMHACAYIYFMHSAFVCIYTQLHIIYDALVKRRDTLLANSYLWWLGVTHTLSLFNWHHELINTTNSSSALNIASSLSHVHKINRSSHLHITNTFTHINITNSVSHLDVTNSLRHLNIINSSNHVQITSSLSYRQIFNWMESIRCH